MIDTITAYIDQHDLLPTAGQLLVAVSGGADSLCLLHLLTRLCGPGKRYPNVSLQAAHLNHKLRGTASEQDAAAVSAIVTAWGVPLTNGEIDVSALAHEERRSLEDAARTARYHFLREVAQGGLIAVAHHADDQVETLLLHWLRGGGLTGMVGMQPRQQDIIRPLLCITHADTVAYCRQHNIVPVEDASNTDLRFTRNRVRHELLPLLESLNPGVRSTLLRNAEGLRVDLEWIETQVDGHWPSVVILEQTDAIHLRLDILQSLSQSLQRHLLRRVTARLCRGQSPLEQRHYVLIEHLLHQEHGAEEHGLRLPGQLRVLRHLKTLVFARHTLQEQPPIFSASAVEMTLPIPGSIEVVGTPWRARAEVVSAEALQTVKAALEHEHWSEVWRVLPSTRYVVYINADVVGPVLHIRTRRPGDRVRPLGMTAEKKVQDVLVDKHIPRSERATLPLFFSSEHCVWVAGVCLDSRVRLTGKTQRIIRLSIESKLSKREVVMHDDIDEILVTKEEIQTKAAELGQQIARDYQGKSLMLLGILKGAVPFIADLARTIDLPLEIDYMAISSYGNSTQSSGFVRILKDLEGPIEHRHILIVEDIVDSGRTLHYLTDVLRQRRPLSLRICTLLDKGRERVKAVELDYIGFQIPDRFVVGYGLDYAQRYRNLPYIGVLKPAIYQEESENPQSQHKSPLEDPDEE